ncbi:hypothetical protein DLM76_18605 [Leptospira yasudae]|uniref:hypothetical protein n=1 Tax=Leptospira yasudae TaxID=2202201 RepID=UPI000E59E604|nr:hypothetical protein [Leptospira yasudae]RHX91174.1 hypothetical protein DLM76_18605 [Leptospira yasudae]
MIAVVSHDAGGAEILSSYVKKFPATYSFVLEGPALSVFQRKLGKISAESLVDAVSNADEILTGTSWQSDLEKQAIVLAKESGKKSVSFLDHWVNYQERFLFRNRRVLPDEIWTGDEDAFALAQKTFPDSTIKLVNNPYFESLEAELLSIKVKKQDRMGDRLLFVCENIRDHAATTKLQTGQDVWGFTEEEAIHFFFDNSSKITSRMESCTFRPHPSDPSGKYDWVIREYPNFDLEVSNKQTLFEQIVEADIILGCESMAMVIGLLAGKKVISCIPPKGKKLSLPQKSIIELRFLN